MTDQPTKIKQILEYWKENYPIISNVQIDRQSSALEELKNTTQYLNKCFSPAILELLKLESIKFLYEKLPKLIEYINKVAHVYIVNGLYKEYNIRELSHENEYLQKLDELKKVFQEINHINFYIDLYERGDRVIELSKKNMTNEYQSYLVRPMKYIFIVNIKNRETK